MNGKKQFKIKCIFIGPWAEKMLFCFIISNARQQNNAFPTIRIETDVPVATLSFPYWLFRSRYSKADSADTVYTGDWQRISSSADTEKSSALSTVTYQGFPTRMVYLYYTSCLRYTFLAGNPRI